MNKLINQAIKKIDYIKQFRVSFWVI